MSCIINNINEISVINNCTMSIGGIKSLLIAPFKSDFYKNITIVDNIVTKIDYPIVFNEIMNDDTISNWKEEFDYTKNLWSQKLQMNLTKYDYNKRQYIQALVKSKVMFIIEDNNGLFYLVGEKNGMSSIQAVAGTGVLAAKSEYDFVFQGFSDLPALGISEDLVKKKVDCGDLSEALALSSTLYWYPYYDCLVGELEGFTEPSPI